ncbi:MAG: ABC transporter permease subunit [Firmicutes bacterium]|nr:ABC transporter permease subunit [Bacillota bacterium]
MDRRAMWAIAIKDIKAIRSSVQVWLPMILVPIVMCALIPGGMIYGVRRFGIEGMGNMGNMDSLAKLIDSLPPGSLRDTITSFDSPEKQVLYFVLNHLFVSFFLIIPLMLSSVITANSFAVEKERGTLETLLFSPVEIRTLFAGKVLSAFIPGMAVTFLCGLVYGIVVNVLAYPLFEELIFPTLNWAVLLLWTIPAVILFAIFINVIISAKVKGFQEAYQLSGLLVLPVLALVLGQALGALVLDTQWLLWGGAMVLALAMGMLGFISRHFDRNRLFESQVS